MGTLLAHKPKHARIFPRFSRNSTRLRRHRQDFEANRNFAKTGWAAHFMAQSPPHRLWIEPAKICQRIVTNGTNKGAKSMPTHPPSALCQRHRDTTSQPQTGQYPATNSSSPQMAIHPRICFHGCAHAFCRYSHPSSSPVRSRIRNNGARVDQRANGL